MAMSSWWQVLTQCLRTVSSRRGRRSCSWRSAVPRPDQDFRFFPSTRPGRREKQSIAGHLDDMGRLAEIESSGLSDGEYQLDVVASMPDGSSLPRVVKLPTVEVATSATGASTPP